MSAKLPKTRLRDPKTGRPLGYTLRPVRIAIDEHGNAHQIDNHTQDSTLSPRTLPKGWRWANDDELEREYRRRLGMADE